MGSFSYTSHADFVFIWGVFLTHPVAGFIFKWGVSITHPMLILFLCGEFLLHISCCPHICLGSLCYTSRAGCCFSFFFFSFLSGEFLLHIPCWLHFYRVSFSYASHGGFPFLWGVSLTHPVLASFLCGSFLFHIFHAECFYVGSFCLFLFVCFYLGSFSYAHRTGFFSLSG